MSTDLLRRIEIDRLAKPIAGRSAGGQSAAGPWLGYERVYDEIKSARTQEADYLPQGIWQRDVKRPRWETVVETAAEVLETRSKDLQIAAWLTEALTYLEGPAGLARGFDAMARLATDFWDTVHPELDAEDGDEPRLLVLQWCDRHLPKGLLGSAVTQPSSRLVEPFTLLEWEALERREPLEDPRDKHNREKAKPRRRGRSSEPPETEENGLSREDLLASARLTPLAYFDAQLAALAEARRALDGLRETFNARCGPGAVRLGKLDATLARLGEKLEEARATLDDGEADEPEGDATDRVPAADHPGGGAEQPKAAPAPKRQSAGRDTGRARNLPREVAAIKDREEAYRVLAAVGERLVTLDPHSPAPYLARRAASFRDHSFTDLVMLLVDDDRQRQHLFRLLGIQEDDHTEAGHGAGGRSG